MSNETIQIEGKTFRFVMTNRTAEADVYTSGDLYLRIGKREAIERIYELHRKYESLGFSVARIVSRGESDGFVYFVEESLGEDCFSQIFKKDIDQLGKMSDESFEAFIDVTTRFTKAQIKTAVSADSVNLFSELIDPKGFAEELPEFSQKIIDHYNASLEAVKNFPVVLTHGDFNPHNLFPKGVIDFENIYYGPLGYDVVTNIFTTEWFPKEDGFEYKSLYHFSEDKISLYYEKMDQIFAEFRLPKLSDYRKHFEFFRAIWQARRNHHMPKIQQWRYELFKNKFL